MILAEHPTFMFVDQSWVDEALCAQTDPDAFFPDGGGSVKQAKKVCAKCPVVEDCLQWALSTNERFGVWGGKSERERRALTPHNTPCPYCDKAFYSQYAVSSHIGRAHKVAA